MRIATHRSDLIICPDEYRWQAFEHDTLDYDSVVGTGATEAAAIEDLCEQLDLDPAEFLPHEPEARA